MAPEEIVIKVHNTTPSTLARLKQEIESYGQERFAEGMHTGIQPITKEIVKNTFGYKQGFEDGKESLESHREVEKDIAFREGFNKGIKKATEVVDKAIVMYGLKEEILKLLEK